MKKVDRYYGYCDQCKKSVRIYISEEYEIQNQVINSISLSYRKYKYTCSECGNIAFDSNGYNVNNALYAYTCLKLNRTFAYQEPKTGKVFAGRYTYDDIDKIFYGSILCEDSITYHADTIEDLEIAFQQAVDDYVEIKFGS